MDCPIFVGLCEIQQIGRQRNSWLPSHDMCCGLDLTTSCDQLKYKSSTGRESSCKTNRGTHTIFSCCVLYIYIYVYMYIHTLLHTNILVLCSGSRHLYIFSNFNNIHIHSLHLSGCNDMGEPHCSIFAAVSHWSRKFAAI